MAEMCSLELPLSTDHIRKTLVSIFQYNFKSSLWGHANPQRPGYALGDEPGLLLCTWPRGGKPTLPFVYSDEVWTGIEYQVGSHLIMHGLLDEGLQVVKATRSRYDGRTRNPWNEYECGSYYARAMASYALLFAISGIAYSAVSKTLTIAPKIDLPAFRSFFSTCSGWGTLLLQEEQLEITISDGYLRLDKLNVTWRNRSYHLLLKRFIKVGESIVFNLIN